MVVRPRLLGVCVATRDSDVSVTWETGHKRPLGRLEISSAQLLDSEQNLRKVVHWVSWWDEVVGMGCGRGRGHSKCYFQEVFGGNKWSSPITSLNHSQSQLEISLEENVLFPSSLMLQLGRLACRGEVPCPGKPGEAGREPRPDSLTGSADSLTGSAGLSLPSARWL